MSKLQTPSPSTSFAFWLEMSYPAAPVDEASRLNAYKNYKVLGGQEEIPAYDELAKQDLFYRFKRLPFIGKLIAAAAAVFIVSRLQ